MLLFIFDILAFSQTHNVTTRTFQTFKLHSNDKLFINAENSDYFLHIQNHFFYGKLKIRIINVTGVESTIDAKPRQRLKFTKCSLEILYSSKKSECKLTLYVVESDMCDSDVIHYSGLKSAQLKIPNNYPSRFKVCYFFEFGSNPTASFTAADYLLSELFYMNENNSLVNYQIKKKSSLAVSKLSILRNRHIYVSRFYYEFNITSKSKFADFTDEDSPFSICEKDSCKLTTTEVPFFDADRSLAWWIWLLIYIVPIVLLTIGISLLLISPKKETSLFTSSRPLISEL